MNDNATEACNAVRDVLAERLRQIREEGWTPQHDADNHDDGVLAAAGASYALNAAEQLHPYTQGDGDNQIPDFWMLDASWWKPTHPRRDLVKAAALIIAEIERLDTMQPDACPVCAEPFRSNDICATDIELGTCHAECLKGAPIVNLETGEPSDQPIATFKYDDDEVAK